MHVLTSKTLYTVFKPGPTYFPFALVASSNTSSILHTAGRILPQRPQRESTRDQVASGSPMKGVVDAIGASVMKRKSNRLMK